MTHAPDKQQPAPLTIEQIQSTLSAEHSARESHIEQLRAKRNALNKEILAAVIAHENAPKLAVRRTRKSKEK